MKVDTDTHFDMSLPPPHSYLLEGIRPEIQQYLIEPEDVAAPYSRVMRNTIYQRAKMKVGTDTHSLGTRRDVYKPVHLLPPSNYSFPTQARENARTRTCMHTYTRTKMKVGTDTHSLRRRLDVYQPVRLPLPSIHLFVTNARTRTCMHTYTRAKMKVGMDTHALGTRRDVYTPEPDPEPGRFLRPISAHLASACRKSARSPLPGCFYIGLVSAQPALACLKPVRPRPKSANCITNPIWHVLEFLQF
jgi:hypothetical protein